MHNDTKYCLCSRTNKGVKNQKQNTTNQGLLHSVGEQAQQNLKQLNKGFQYPYIEQAGKQERFRSQPRK